MTSDIQKKVYKQDDTEIYDFTRKLYKTAYSLTGFNVDKEKLQVLVPATAQMLKQYHKYDHPKDIFEAVKMGALGELGEYQGINAKTIHNWIKRYPYKTKPEKPKPKILNQGDQTEQIWQDAKDKIANNETPLGLAHLYEIAQKKGLVNLTEEFKEKCRQAARTTFTRRKQEAKKSHLLKQLNLKAKDEKGISFQSQCKREAAKFILNDEVRKDQDRPGGQQSTGKD